MATLRKDGRYQASKRTANGTIYGYGTTPEEANADLRRKLDPTPATSNEVSTLHDFIKTVWYPSLSHLAPGSLKDYVGSYRCHIGPTFGKMKIEDIEGPAIQDWVNGLTTKRPAKKGQPARTEPLSPKTKHDRLNLLKSILLMAKDYGYPVAHIPWKRITTDPAPPKRNRVIEPGEASELLDKASGTCLSAPVFLALVLGLRRGEVAGLRWSHLDRVKGELRIESQRQGVTRKGTVERAPKWGSSRTLRLTPRLIEEIDARGDLDNEYICTYGGEPFVPDTITEKWNEKKGEWGYPDWHFHDLRHGAAGLLYALTKDLLVVAAVLGHKKLDTSIIYVGQREQSAADGLKLLDALLPDMQV